MSVSRSAFSRFASCVTRLPAEVPAAVCGMQSVAATTTCAHWGASVYVKSGRFVAYAASSVRKAPERSDFWRWITRFFSRSRSIQKGTSVVPKIVRTLLSAPDMTMAHASDMEDTLGEATKVRPTGVPFIAKKLGIALVEGVAA